MIGSERAIDFASDCPNTDARKGLTVRVKSSANVAPAGRVASRMTANATVASILTIGSPSGRTELPSASETANGMRTVPWHAGGGQVNEPRAIGGKEQPEVRRDLDVQHEPVLGIYAVAQRITVIPWIARAL